MTDLQEPQDVKPTDVKPNHERPPHITTPANAVAPEDTLGADSARDDNANKEAHEEATGLRILIVLVTMFVFMFIVALVGLFFVARR